MNIDFNRRTALILATGLWVGLGHVAPGVAQEAEPAPAPAATEAPAGKPIALKKFTKQHVTKKKVASTGKTDNKADKVKAAKAKTSEAPADAPATVAEDAGKDALPASIANANAQIAAEATPDPFAPASAAQAGPLQADALIKSVGADPHQEASLVTDPAAQVVPADELNEIDRAAEARPALTLASATLDAPAPAPAAEASAADNSTWDKTSLIGKVFIAFGGLLTMASAARMFIA